jgi:hypothetical protein
MTGPGTSGVVRLFVGEDGRSMVRLELATGGGPTASYPLTDEEAGRLGAGLVEQAMYAQLRNTDYVVTIGAAGAGRPQDGRHRPGARGCNCPLCTPTRQSAGEDGGGPPR